MENLSKLCPLHGKPLGPLPATNCEECRLEIDKTLQRSNEDRYETINILIRSRNDGKSWFDVIFDLVTETCIPLEDPDNVPDDYECPCGLVSMGGSGGTLDQCYDHDRLTEKWAVDVQTEDLKRILSIAVNHLEVDDLEAYNRLKKAAYWHDDFESWLDEAREKPGYWVLEEEEFELDEEFKPYFSTEPLPKGIEG